MIDHTLLAPEATPNDIGALCAEAKTLGTYAVCVSPTLTTVAARERGREHSSGSRRWPGSRPARTSPG